MTVTSELDTTDPKSSSLRTTILAANTVGGDNTIILTNNIYKLTISGRNEDAASSGDLDITRGNLTIIGLSLSNVIVTAAGLGDRVFQVLPGAQLTLSNLCITGGTGSDGTNADFSVGGNGESGGGIYNAGTLTLKNCTVMANSSGAGGYGFFSGNGGDGGGIYNVGTLTLESCTIVDNRCGPGGVGGFASCGGCLGGSGGTGGAGGGIYNAGTLTLQTSSIRGNFGGPGGVGVYGGGGNGGNGGAGGGIYNVGTSTINDCTVSDNAAGAGNAGVPSPGGVFGGGTGGNGGHGGGICSVSSLALDTCTVSGNSSGAGGNGADAGPSYEGLGGNGGHGGGIYTTGPLTLTACTASGNSSGAGGNPGAGGPEFPRPYGGSGGGGGGIFNAGAASVILRSSLIGLNSTGRGGLRSADGYGPDGFGGFSSQGYNLIGQGDGATGLLNGTNGDRLGTSVAPLDPILGPLQWNGGQTMTHALLPGSPAIDQGKSFGDAFDQRGRARAYDHGAVPNAVDGDGSDIGAFEGDTPILSITKLLNGSVITWETNGNRTLEYTHDLNLQDGWTRLTNAWTTLSGQCYSTNGPAIDNRFFRLR